MPINKIKIGCVIPCYKGGEKTIDVGVNDMQEIQEFHKQRTAVGTPDEEIKENLENNEQKEE